MEPGDGLSAANAVQTMSLSDPAKGEGGRGARGFQGDKCCCRERRTIQSHGGLPGGGEISAETHSKNQPEGGSGSKLE